jgi:uncharacterized protein YjbI with pentapeptide repeats
MIEIRHKETGQVLHRTGTDTLAGAPLSGRMLRGADLRRADLAGANLYRISVSSADLTGASLANTRAFKPRAHLGWRILPLPVVLVAGYVGYQARLGAVSWPPWMADLGTGFAAGACFFLAVLWILLLCDNEKRRSRTATFQGTNLRRADLTEACLSGADFTRADFREATLTRSRLARSMLREANLAGADLQDSCLYGADLSGADLQLARLVQADLRLSNLHDADLRSADLRQADLRNADLRQADLRGTDLRAQLEGVKLTGARYDDTTRWPASFEPARRGAVTVAEAVPVEAPRGRGDEPSPCSSSSAERKDR